MKFFFLLPLFYFYFQSNEIKWTKSNPLTWENFSGEIDTSSQFEAWTWSGFRYTYSWKRMDVTIFVDCTAYAFFDPAQSWIKKLKKSDELLKHEQVHFDISELFSRYFEERIAMHDFSNQVEHEIDSIYNVTFQELLDAQVKYDTDTEHYRNKEEQKRWEEFVHSELVRLKEFE